MSFVNSEVGNIHFTVPRNAAETPLILIHGAGGDALSWPPQIRRASDYPAIAIELPGHGKSTGDSSPRLEPYVHAVEAVLHELQSGRLGPPVGSRFVLAGHSMGGAIAQLFALQHPARLAGLVLIGAGARLRVDPLLLTGLCTDFSETISLIVDWSHAAAATPALRARSHERLAAVPADTLHDDFAACDAFDVTETIGDWRGPTLIVCGAEDRMTPPKYSEWLAAQLADARLEIIPAAGHMVLQEQPGQVTEVIGKFMNALRDA